MKCERCKELLSWYLESGLQSKEIEEHLSVCKECSDELKLLEKMLILIKELPQIDPSDQVCSQIIEKVERTKKSKKVIYIWKQVQDEDGLEVFVHKNRSRINYQFQTRIIKRLDGVWWRFVKISFP